MRQTHAAGERLFVDYAGDGVPVVDRLTGEIKKAQIFVAVLGVTRRQLLEQIDRPALKPLPAEPYVFSEWRVRRVGIDYHVEVAGRYYSVPCRFARAEVDVRLNAKTVDRSRTHAVPPPAICGLDDRAHPRRRAPDRPRDRNAVRADPLVCTAWPRRSPKPPPTAKPKFSAITNGWGFYLIASGHGGRTSASRRDCVSQGCGSRPCVEDVDYRSPRGLDRALFQNLIEGEWINVWQSGAHRPNRRRQELACFGAWPQSVPRQPFGPLPARAQAL